MKILQNAGFLFVVLISLASVQAITGDAISNPLDINITVSVVGPPTLLINQPFNGTYNTMLNIPLNLSLSGHQAVWFHLNNGSNVTYTAVTRINASEGQNILYVYANNSEGTTVNKTRTFTINNTVRNITYEKFKGEEKGASTDLYAFTEQQIQNITNLIFENSTSGKIHFPQELNLTQIGSTLNFDNFINIKKNYIELNSTALSYLNQSATITFYDLTTTNPRVLKDGAVCTSCTNLEYTSGALQVSVTGFSTYTTEETPSTSSSGTGSSGGGGGGGGGGGSSSVAKTGEKIELSDNEIHVSLKQGQVSTQEITLTNKGTEATTITFEAEKISEFISFPEKEIQLKAGERKTINIQLFAPEDAVPNLYLGKILVKGKTTTQEVLVALDLSSKGALFDLIITIPQKSKISYPGEDMQTTIKLINLGTTNRIDALVRYTITDAQGDTLIQESESLAVETQLSYIKEFKLPDDARPGRYVIYATVTYEGKSASASALFTIQETGTFDSYEFFTKVIVVCIIIGIFLLIYLYKREKRQRKLFRQVLREQIRRRSKT